MSNRIQTLMSINVHSVSHLRLAPKAKEIFPPLGGNRQLESGANSSKISSKISANIGRYKATLVGFSRRITPARSLFTATERTAPSRLLIRRFWVRNPGGAPETPSSEASEPKPKAHQDLNHPRFVQLLRDVRPECAAGQTANCRRRIRRENRHRAIAASSTSPLRSITARSARSVSRWRCASVRNFSAAISEISIVRISNGS